VAIAWGFLRRIPAGLRPDLRWRRFGPPAAAVTVLGILLLVPLGLAIPASLLGREGIAVQAVARDLPWLGPACLLQAFAQELQFRGMLLGALERVTGSRAALVAQAALFGVAHLAIQYPGPVGPFIPVTFAFGLLFGLVVQRTSSLWPAVLIHAAADIAITAAVLPGLYGF
jgi:membrane protease YdiL (CAAX protease family)